MGKFETEEPGSAADPVGDEVSKQDAEHENLLHEAKVIREKIADKRRDLELTNNIHDKMLYTAAFRLTHALCLLLDESTQISKVGPETARPGNADPYPAREEFIFLISEALNNLGMDGDAAKQALIDAVDIRE